MSLSDHATLLARQCAPHARFAPFNGLNGRPACRLCTEADTAAADAEMVGAS